MPGINKHRIEVTEMPRTKGSKNRAKADFDAQIAKLQKDKGAVG